MFLIDLIHRFDMRLALDRIKRIQNERAEPVAKIMEERGLGVAEANAFYDMNGRMTTGWDALTEIGVSIPAGGTFESEEDRAEFCASAIEAAVHGMAACGVFVIQTDHLSDIELWERLNQSLSELVPECDPVIATEFVCFVSDLDHETGRVDQVVVKRSAWLPKPPAHRAIGNGGQR